MPGRGDLGRQAGVSRAADLLRSAEGREWVDEDGERERLELLPPLSDAEIDRLAEEWGAPVPAEAREILRVARGFDASPLESVDFGGMPGGAAWEEGVPRSVAIAHDGFGNYWIVDLTTGSEAFGPVFFLCHDCPCLVYQCADAAELVEAVLEMTEPPHRGPIDFVHEDATAAICRGRETAMTRDEALASGDAVLRAFAEPLPADARIADLRRPRTGDGFRILRSRTYLRHPTERILAWHAGEHGGGLLGRLRARLFGG